MGPGTGSQRLSDEARSAFVHSDVCVSQSHVFTVAERCVFNDVLNASGQTFLCLLSHVLNKLLTCLNVTE